MKTVIYKNQSIQVYNFFLNRLECYYKFKKLGSLDKNRFNFETQIWWDSEIRAMAQIFDIGFIEVDFNFDRIGFEADGKTFDVTNVFTQFILNENINETLFQINNILKQNRNSA